MMLLLRRCWPRFVDHDCARVLQDLIAENAALRQELQDFQGKLRGQAFEIFELHNIVAHCSSAWCAYFHSLRDI